MNARHLAPLVSLVLAGLSTLGHATVVNRAITEAEVTAAQAAWCQALVDISAANDKGGQPAAKALAEKVIDAAYGYQLGRCCLPTLAAAPQTFRTTVRARWPTLWGRQQLPQGHGLCPQRLDALRSHECRCVCRG